MAYEPDWREFKQRMYALTLKEPKSVMEWFRGRFEGSTGKDARIGIMARQMKHWWNDA